MSSRYIFFSLRDFKADTGETVRIYGMLNALAAANKPVIFISNAQRFDMFHPGIKHIAIGHPFSDKRKIQGLLGLFPWQVAYSTYKGLFNKIAAALQLAQVGSNPVFFFDYLDNSIGYVLKKKGLISRYINDIHGIATLEFKSHVQNSHDVARKMSNHLKLFLIERLDKKVFENADGFIFGSDAMRKFYESEYNISKARSNIIPYVLGEDAPNRTVDINLKKQLVADWQIDKGEFVVLFVGGYKPTAGVDDLIHAFDKLHADYRNCKLILIGGGPLKPHCMKLVESMYSRNKILFIEQIPYSKLLTCQSIANVIVCPDRDNPFSQYVIHIKYFDALLSGQLVINGAFESVKEVNPNDILSLTFQPSNVRDLYMKLKQCVENYDRLKEKYKNTRTHTIQHLTYTSFLDRLEALISPQR